MSKFVRREYLGFTSEQIIESAEQLNYDNFRLAPGEVKEHSDKLTYFKVVWLTEKSEDIDRSKYVTKQKTLDEEATEMQKFKFQFQPSNKELEVLKGDKYGYLSNMFTSIITSSMMKIYDDGKKDGKKDEKAPRNATVSITAMTAAEIGGGDYVPMIKEDMSEKQKEQEIDRCAKQIAKIEEKTKSFVKARIAVDKAWRIFCEKIKLTNKFSADESTKVSGIVQYSTELKDPVTQEKTTKFFERPIARISFPIFNYSPEGNHGKLAKSKNKHIGRYFKTDKGDEQWTPILYAPPKGTSDEDAKNELKVLYVDPETSESRKVSVNTKNMGNALTAKSLIGGKSNIMECNISPFGISLKETPIVCYVRKHVKKATGAFMKAEELADLGAFAETEEDTGFDPSEELMEKQKKKHDKFAKKSKKDDSDDDEKPKKSRKPKKKKDESDSEDEKPKKKKDESDSEDEKPKKKKDESDSEDEEEIPKKSKKKGSDSEDEKPKKSKKKGSDDEDEKPKKSKKKGSDDEDDEIPKKSKKKNDEEAPKKSKPKKKGSDDEDEDEAPKKSKKKSDDEEEKPKKSNKKKGSDDEEEAPKKSKKKESDDESKNEEKEEPKKEEPKKEELKKRDDTPKSKGDPKETAESEKASEKTSKPKKNKKPKDDDSDSD